MKIENQRLLWGFAAGIAAAAVLPVLMPVARDIARPLLKSLLKHGMLSVERARTALARAGEAAQDIIAEVSAEVEMELAPHRPDTASESAPFAGNSRAASQVGAQKTMS